MVCGPGMLGGGGGGGAGGGGGGDEHAAIRNAAAEKAAMAIDRLLFMVALPLRRFAAD
jgi:hypothetical protein